jgi:hypothetical protein
MHIEFRAQRSAQTGTQAVNRTVKWTMVSVVAFGAMAQAQACMQNTANNYNTYPICVRRPFMMVPADGTVYTNDSSRERKSPARSRVPTKIVQTKSRQSSVPSKPDLPPPPPSKQTPPPPVVYSPPPAHAPPATNSLPPVHPPVTNWPPLGRQPPAAAPEIDARSALSGLALLVGGLLVLRGGRSRSLVR